MNIYLVGGAVRDHLLGLNIQERDWVVVGATPQMMLSLGYLPVGKDFPVFLHPVTHEEYALARTEKKIGLGYTGFTFYTSPEVTLEEDLLRRDLTINAMAQTTEGQIIDPYGGQDDLKAKLLRHVSDAFVEDPVRILRVARFMARFEDFHIHPNTQHLMQVMVQQGEVQALVAERVWQECKKALCEANPQRFFESLIACGAQAILFPALDRAGFEALHRAAQSKASLVIRFAALTHTLKSDQIKTLCARYKIPKNLHDAALLTIKTHHMYADILKGPTEVHLNLLETWDVFRRPDRLSLFLNIAQIISAHPQSAQINRCWQTAYEAAKSVDIKALLAQTSDGQAIKSALRIERLKRLNH